MYGIKLGLSFRYYFKRNAPIGWYIEPKFSVGYFQTDELFDKYLCKYNSTNEISYCEDIDGGKVLVTFMTAGISLKVGNQKYFGKSDRFVFDYNFGFQYFPYKENPTDDETIEYFDEYGNKTIVFVEYNGNFVNGLVWYTIGAGSVIYANLSIGYNF
jgi:hypothetical protein